MLEPVGLCGPEGASAPHTDAEGVELTGGPARPVAPWCWEAWPAQRVVLFRVKNGFPSVLSLHSGPPEMICFEMGF